MTDAKNKNEIILSASLKSYFFKQLRELNKNSLCPVPEETIYYSSEVLEQYSCSTDYFDFEDGKPKEKILGMQLLEAENFSKEKKKRVYKDVGDTALILTGYFSKSINDKIVSSSYYTRLGQTAYEKLNNAQPNCFDIPSFYKIMATCFENISQMLSILVEKNESQREESYLLKQDGTLRQSILGISPNPSKKVS